MPIPLDDYKALSADIKIHQESERDARKTFSQVLLALTAGVLAGVGQLGTSGPPPFASVWLVIAVAAAAASLIFGVIAMAASIDLAIGKTYRAIVQRSGEPWRDGENDMRVSLRDVAKTLTRTQRWQVQSWATAAVSYGIALVATILRGLT